MLHRFLSTTLLTLILVMTLAAAALAAPPRNFAAPMSGEGQIDPVDTDATGMATFKLSHDGTELSYRVNVANVFDVFQAHIHLEHSNGPIVAWLHTEEGVPELVPGRVSGELVTGTLTADSLGGPLEDQDLDALIEEILAGNAFVNVHTEEHPGGEIAGQISRPRGHIAD